MKDSKLFYIVLVFPFCIGFQKFQNLIPNGQKVPNPCTGNVWDGLGHINPRGGADRNPFGMDFMKNGKTWNSKLCFLDSDNDGLTNGEELGDPGCEWVPGTVPENTVNISHPGICEPLESDKCKEQNDWLDCSEDDNCAALNQQDVKKIELRIPKVTIPTKQTTYQCQIFDLPEVNRGTYHMIGTKPIIDNKDITHHILLFGCDERSGPLEFIDNVPYECGMLAHRQCVHIIGTWTVGSTGDCFHNSSGFRIGQNGFKRVAMQIHWNNPSLIPNLTDSSGLELYYTKILRSYDAGMFVFGQEYLEIPPEKPEVTFQSSCSPDCTKVMFPKSVYITRAVNHMHYQGRSQKIEIYRNNIKIRDITNDDNYSYERPIFYKFDPPIEIKPGDEIRTTCSFSSLSSNETTYFGEGTSDEMCYGFVTYYPVQDIALPSSSRIPTSTSPWWKTGPVSRAYVPGTANTGGGVSWAGRPMAHSESIPV